MPRQASGSPARSPESAASPVPARRTQRERSSQAEQALLDAAATLFALRGVDQTSLADVGELAGYSRGMVNHHFGSKAKLVAELAKRTQAQFVAQLEHEGLDPFDVLVKLVETYLVDVVRHDEIGRAFFVMWGTAIQADASLRTVFASDDAQFRLGVEALLRAGQDNGTVDPVVDPSSAAVAVVGMLRGVGAQYLIDPDAIDLPAAVRTCQQFVRQSFAPTRKSVRAKR